MNQTEYLGELAAAEDLEAAVKNEADAIALSELRADAAEKRRQDRAGAIGHNVLVQTGDGSLVDQQTVSRELNQGHEVTGPYNGGAHSAN